MFPSLRFLPLAAAALLACGPSSLAAPDFAKDVKPMLETYCWSCHANGKKKGGISFDGERAMGVATDHKFWESVLENVKGGIMPPDEEGQKQPTLAEREALQKWIEAAVFAVDPDNPDPGRVTIRRLNRTEYNNAIHDLLGVDYQPAEDFPADDSGYGFDNIGDVLSLPPVLFDRYLRAAETIMGTAILNDHKPRMRTLNVDLTTIQGGPAQGSTPASRKIDERDSTLEITLNEAGDHGLKMLVQSQKIGAEATKVEVKFNDQLVGTKALNGSKDGIEPIVGPLKGAKVGTNKISFRVLNPLSRPETKNGKPVVRAFTIRELKVTTPPQKPVAPATQIRLFKPGKGKGSLDASARAILIDFATRAFRRPVTRPEIERFMWIYGQAGKKGGNFEQSVQTALTAVLVSPHFLFRGEMQPEPDSPKSVHKVNEWALGSRMSFFLWSTMPDDQLFGHAQAGSLRGNLEQQVRRMLKSPKANMLVENFAGQWLQTRNMRLVEPDAQTFPDWDSRLAEAMEKETQMLFQTIMREDRSVLEFLSADYTFVNERLAEHYGIPGVEGDAFTRVKLPENRPGGILGHGSFLTLTSNPTRTSPVKRGKYVLENILATPPPPAPPDVPDLADANRKELTGTLRQRMEQHRVNPVCSSCHARMDPIGFGMENFDGIGAWRDKDGVSPVDSSGQLVSGEKFNGPAELQKVLINQKRQDFFRCMAEKMLTYALGRGLEYYDKPAVEKIVVALGKDSKFSTLVMEVVKSVPFQMRRGEGDHRKFSAPAPVQTAQAAPPAPAPVVVQPAVAGGVAKN